MTGGPLDLGISVEIVQDQIYVGAETAPNESWRFVDTEGHGHFYSTKSDPYPTLSVVTLPCDRHDHEGCLGHTTYVCRVCRQVVLPGARHASKYVPGPEIVIVRLDDGTTTREWSPHPHSLQGLVSDLQDLVVERLAPYLIRQTPSGDLNVDVR